MVTGDTKCYLRGVDLEWATLNGKLYAAGGYDGNVFLKTVECYDPGTDTWTLMAPMNVKRSRVALVANCGKLYAIGGYDGVFKSEFSGSV